MGNFGPKRAHFWPKKADFGCQRANFGPERSDFRSERVDLSLFGPISGLKEPDLGLRNLGGGRGVQTYVRKFTRVLKDISPLGPLPKTDNPSPKRSICHNSFL